VRPLTIYTHIVESHCPAAYLALDKEGLSPHQVVLTGPTSYGRFLVAEWVRGEGFVQFEHDVVPPPGLAVEIRDCPEMFCVAPYPQQGGNLDASLGCVKVSRALITRTCGAPSAGNLVWDETEWPNVDGAFYDALERFGVFLRPSVDRRHPDEVVAHWHGPCAHVREPNH
jgi:hypothetical protein